MSVIAPWTPILARFDYAQQVGLALLSVPFLCAGLALFWIAHRDLGEYWSPTLALKENHSLITNGIYGSIRHPMYLSIWLVVLGQALCIPNYVGRVGGLVAWALLYFVRIGKEEAMLVEKFGDAYREYMKRTKRLIPGVV